MAVVQTETPVVDLNGPETEGVHTQVTFIEGSSKVLLVSPTVAITPPAEASDGRVAGMRAQLNMRPDGVLEVLSVVVPPGSGVDSSFDLLSGELRVDGAADAAVYADILRSLSYIDVVAGISTGQRVVVVELFFDGLPSFSANAFIDVQGSA